MKKPKTLAEYKIYSETLKETIKDLTEENRLLKAGKKSNIQIAKDQDDIDETICKMQLKKLNANSLSRELTMEETKKVEIFTKLLIALQQRPKREDNTAKDLSDDDLLADVINIGKKDR